MNVPGLIRLHCMWLWLVMHLNSVQYEFVSMFWVCVRLKWISFLCVCAVYYFDFCWIKSAWNWISLCIDGWMGGWMDDWMLMWFYAIQKSSTIAHLFVLFPLQSSHSPPTTYLLSPNGWAQRIVFCMHFFLCAWVLFSKLSHNFLRFVEELVVSIGTTNMFIARRLNS